MKKVFLIFLVFIGILTGIYAYFSGFSFNYDISNAINPSYIYKFQNLPSYINKYVKKVPAKKYAKKIKYEFEYKYIPRLTHAFKTEYITEFKRILKKEDNSNKLTFWSIQLKPIYENEINEIIKTFEMQHPEIKVVWVDIPIQEAQKRTLASILSSTPPDLINLNPDFSVALAQKGALRYFSENEVEQFEPALVEKLKYKDKIYALPFYATSPVTIYNKEIYSKCGNKKDFIQTYDELYEISKSLKDCSNIAPFASNLAENDTLARILNKYDVSSLDDIEIENAKKVYMMFNDMYKKDYMPKDTLSINHREVIEKYMSNQALSIIAGSNFINMIKQNAPDIYSKSAISPQLQGSNGAYDVALMNLIIPKRSKHQDLAYEFAKLLTNEKNQLELAHITNVLPANKYALNNDYFKTCSNELYDSARCIAASQLENLNTVTFGEKNKKTINESINSTLEKIILNNADVNREIKQLSALIQILQKD